MSRGASRFSGFEGGEVGVVVGDGEVVGEAEVGGGVGWVVDGGQDDGDG